LNYEELIDLLKAEATHFANFFGSYHHQGILN